MDGREVEKLLGFEKSRNDDTPAEAPSETPAEPPTNEEANSPS